MTLLADAIRNMGHEALLRAFERQHLSAEARTLIRAELLRRLSWRPTDAQFETVLAGAAGAIAGASIGRREYYRRRRK
jgi:hypothetical protein